MASVFDVAAYLLSKTGSMTGMKLQKLVYYAQAWSLVWDERPLFPESIKAWANGPVCPQLYRAHQGCFMVDPGHISGNPSAIDPDGQETIDIVLKFYGQKTAQWLSDLTHSEEPWQEARRGLPLGERGNVEITHSSIADYYSSLS